ncbi:hypothetical protein [Jongsikchunia kroppenstedtii]|uniref:hypothetical protein n=1 Tax=Jongsikchunia kroppenstedtii TaxID=1121721 RepID=UPI00035DF444|nr:hypothetical protein [Jongsikchunia kroppenstedtii]
MTEGVAALPADPTVDQLLHASPLGPVLDTPVSQILAGLGLPPLPQVPPLPPLPGLPPLPTIDVGQLIRPITDLLGGFGTGDLGSAGTDPTAFLEGISQALDLSMSMGSAALQALDGLWSGQGAIANTATSAQAQADSAALGTQATGIRANTAAAAAIVGAGLAAVQGVVIKTAGLIAGAGPALLTPPGQAFALGAAADGLAEATAIVVATRAQLAAPTAGVAAAGAPIPISGAPSGGASPFAIANALLDGLRKPLSALGSQAAQTAAGRTVSAADLSDRGSSDAEGMTALPASTAAAGLGGAGAGGGVGAHVAPRAPLSARTPGAALGQPVDAVPAGRVAAAGGAVGTGYLPMGATGTARGAGASEQRHQAADYLTTAPNGREIVGEMGAAAPAVIGDESPSRPGAAAVTHADTSDE